MKQHHCIPICAMPNKLAAQAKLEISLQQRTSSKLVGSTSILARVHVAEVVPSNMKDGDNPSEERL